MSKFIKRRGFGFAPTGWAACALVALGAAVGADAVADDAENLMMSQSVPDYVAFDSALSTWFAGEKTGKGLTPHLRGHMIADAIGAEPTKAGGARVREVTARMRALLAQTNRARDKRRAEIYCSDSIEKAPYRTLVDTSDRMDIENEILDRQQLEAGLGMLGAEERVAMQAYLDEHKRSMSYLQISIGDLLQQQYPDMSEGDRREYLYANLLEKCAAVTARLKDGEGSR